MAEPDGAVDVDALVAETLEFLTLQPDGEDPDRWVGDAPEWFGEYLFGGFVISQALLAATRSLAAGRSIRSRAGSASTPRRSPSASCGRPPLGAGRR